MNKNQSMGQRDIKFTSRIKLSCIDKLSYFFKSLLKVFIASLDNVSDYPH